MIVRRSAITLTYPDHPSPTVATPGYLYSNPGAAKEVVALYVNAVSKASRHETTLRVSRENSIDLFASTCLPSGPPLLATVMTVGHTASYHSGSRSLASIPRNGSDCGSRCRTLGPTVVFLFLGWRRRICGRGLSRRCWRARIRGLRLR